MDGHESMSLNLSLPGFLNSRPAGVNGTVKYIMPRPGNNTVSGRIPVFAIVYQHGYILLLAYVCIINFCSSPNGSRNRFMSDIIVLSHTCEDSKESYLYNKTSYLLIKHFELILLHHKSKQ